MRWKGVVPVLVLALLICLVWVVRAHASSITMPDYTWATDFWDWVKNVFDNLVGKIIALIALIWFVVSLMTSRYGQAVGAFIVFIVMAIASGLVNAIFG